MSQRVLAILAHPERRSLNGLFFDESINQLQGLGKEVQISDLCRMNFKPTIDRADFPRYDKDIFSVTSAIKEAESARTLPDVIVREQQKIIWADCLVFQFPIWWFSFPAILKGWLDRVVSFGFGKQMAGKGVLFSVTAGSPQPKRPDDQGDISKLLLPMLYGFSCLGCNVAPPVVMYDVFHTDEARVQSHISILKSQLTDMVNAPKK